MNKTQTQQDITLTKIYGGDIIVKFYEKSHQYWISTDGGKKFNRATGTTSYLNIKDKSRPLGMWQQQVTAEFLLDCIAKGIAIDEDKAIEAAIQNDIQKEKAADIGKEIHAWCEAFIRHELKQPGFEKLPDMPDFKEGVTGVNAFLDWRAKHNVKFLSTERVVYSKKHEYIGTMDLEAIIDGVHCIGDFKSSNGLYNGVRMQTAAYLKADTEEREYSKDKKFKGYGGRWAIRLSKYSEEEYMRKENLKKLVKQAIARIKGQESKDYPIKPYQVFEAVFLDKEPGMLDADYSAFKHCIALSEWDKATDPYTRGSLE